MNNELQAFERGCKQSARRLADGLLFLCLAGLLSSGVSAEPARVEEVHGDVSVRAVGAFRWESVTPGEKIEEGSSIRTGPNSEIEIAAEEGHRFVIHSETTLTFTSLQADETKVRLDSGRVLSRVVKLKEKQRFSVQTPTAVCAVRGTEFETTAGDRGTFIAVYKGIVGIAVIGGREELALHAGQMTSVHNGIIDRPRPVPRESRAREETALAHTARHEVGLDMTRAQVIASAALERRLADYQEGKSLIDVSGQRVRIEEYVMRPAANQFKFVVLDERGQSRLDYFFYKGTFNQDLPADLSVALKDLSGKVGTSAPDYYLTAYEMGQSNTQDSVHDTASGGHLVQIAQDGQGNYILTDPSDPANVRTIPAVQIQTGANGDVSYKIYNPLADSFSFVTEAQLSAATRFGVYIPENATFRDLAPNDTLWKTRFNTYEHDLNSVMKQSYTKASGITNVLSSNQDASWTYYGGFMVTVVTPDANNIDATITNYYGTVGGVAPTYESYRTVLIDDHGVIAPQSAFSGISTGAEYKGELLKWNYEQQVSATEFHGRKIDLVVEPRIFIESGLIQ